MTPFHGWRGGDPGKAGNVPLDHTACQGKGQHFQEEECFKIILASKNSTWLGLADSEGSGFTVAPICFSGMVQPNLLWL